MERENAELLEWDWDELHWVSARDMELYDALPRHKRDIVKGKDFKGLRGA